MIQEVSQTFIDVNMDHDLVADVGFISIASIPVIFSAITPPL